MELITRQIRLCVGIPREGNIECVERVYDGKGGCKKNETEEKTGDESLSHKAKRQPANNCKASHDRTF
jgi:CRISPR/Cas system-associated endonuclease Cas3-HD